ncbi:hypothetical protein C2S51_002002 [Perilla frutescens var. frutescens]|nr:hypothetical protein C2S51_002002 [Perilla frutescens var. frutescens]
MDVLKTSRSVKTKLLRNCCRDGGGWECVKWKERTDESSHFFYIDDEEAFHNNIGIEEEDDELMETFLCSVFLPSEAPSDAEPQTQPEPSASTAAEGAEEPQEEDENSDGTTNEACSIFKLQHQQWCPELSHLMKRA